MKGMPAGVPFFFCTLPLIPLLRGEGNGYVNTSTKVKNTTDFIPLLLEEKGLGVEVNYNEI